MLGKGLAVKGNEAVKDAFCRVVTAQRMLLRGVVPVDLNRMEADCVFAEMGI